MNVLVETSGRDIASYDYVEKIFASHPAYQKLVVHFTINDLKYAEKSVDTRMIEEMKAGRDIVAAQLQSSSSQSSSTSTSASASTSANTSANPSASAGASASARAVVSVNAGGPYGSEVLQGVQADSDKV